MRHFSHLFSLSLWIQTTQFFLFFLQLLALQFCFKEKQNFIEIENQSQDVCIHLQLIPFQNPIQMNKTQLMNSE